MFLVGAQHCCALLGKINPSGAKPRF